MHELDTVPPTNPQVAPTVGAADMSAMAARVAATLRNRIVRGQLAPRARIIERQVSAELAVSRTPVREALKLLEADGLIEISRNRGAQVTGYSPAVARNLFDVIAVLEGLAAERLAKTITPLLLAKFEGLHAEMLSHYRARALDPYFDVNSAIHDLIITSVCNPDLSESHRRLMLRARRGRFLAILGADRWAQSIEEHEVLMQALRDGNGPAAFAGWRIHLTHTGDTVAAVLEERGEA
jgi:DNA-binding GntR family transcriptional regulator